MNDAILSDKVRLDQIKRVEKRMKVCDYLAAIIGVSGILIMAPESSLYYNNLEVQLQPTFDCLKANDNNFDICLFSVKNVPEQPYASFLRALVTLGTIIVEIFLVMRYALLIKYKKHRREIRLAETLCRSRIKWVLLMEMIYILMHLPPHVNYTWIGVQQGNELTYTLDTLFTITLIFRVYLVFRVVSVYSVLNSERAIETCNQNSCEGGPTFALKAEVKTRPYIITGSGMVIFVFALGFATKILEQPYEYVSGLNWNYVWNGLWCVIITMTTVGYGDFYPRTYLGRTAIVIAAIIGSFLVSLMVVAMGNSSSFDHAEQRAFDKYKKIEEVKELRKHSVKTAAAAYRLHAMIKNGSASRFKLNSQTEKLKSNLLQFRGLRKKFVTGELSTPLSYLADEFQYKLNIRLDKMFYFEVALQKMQIRVSNLALSQQAIGDLADKVYSQSLLFEKEMQGKKDEKFRIKQTIKPKESEQLQKKDDVDAIQKILDDQMKMYAETRKNEEEPSSPRKRKAMFGGTGGISTGNKMAGTSFDSLNATNKSPKVMSPDQTLTNGLDTQSKIKAKSGYLPVNFQDSPLISPENSSGQKFQSDFLNAIPSYNTRKKSQFSHTKNSSRIPSLVIEEEPADQPNKQSENESPKIPFAGSPDIKGSKPTRNAQNANPNSPETNNLGHKKKKANVDQQNLGDLTTSPERQSQSNPNDFQPKSPSKLMIEIPDDKNANDSPSKIQTLKPEKQNATLNPDDLKFDPSSSRPANDIMLDGRSPMERFLLDRLKDRPNGLQAFPPTKKDEEAPLIRNKKVVKQPQEDSKKNEPAQKPTPKGDILPNWLNKNDDPRVNQKPLSVNPNDGGNLNNKPQFGKSNEGAPPDAWKFFIPKDNNPLANQPNVVKYIRSRENDNAKNLLAVNNPTNNIVQDPITKFRSTPAFVIEPKTQPNTQAPRLSKLNNDLAVILNIRPSPKVGNKGMDAYKLNLNDKGPTTDRLLGFGPAKQSNLDIKLAKSPKYA